ncbi:MAG: hypothetical protein COA62_00630 [Rhodobiaceae bacterium]|nr:MAG: hypothetical protein COA62_00630 [Rhodobiaceae bacterium]
MTNEPQVTLQDLKDIQNQALLASIAYDNNLLGGVFLEKSIDRFDEFYGEEAGKARTETSPRQLNALSP